MSKVLLDRAVEKQNRVWGQMQEIQERAEREGRDLTAEERQAWDAAEADLTAASSDIERFERSAKLDKVDRDKIITGDGEEREATDRQKRYNDAFSAYVRRGLGRLNEEQRELLESGYAEVRDQGIGTDPIGGYTVPEGFRNVLVETMKAFGGLMGAAEGITTDTGQNLPWVTLDDTGNEGEIIAENVAVTQQDLAYGGRSLKAHIFSSKMVKVPMTLLQDGAFNPEEYIPRKLGERIGRRAARSFITGTGVDEPEGITTNITVGKTGTTGQTTSIIYDDLLDLEHSVDVAYRNPRCRFLMHDLSLKAIRKLKDTQGHPIWVPVPTTGMSATINGWPYLVDNSMPQMAANKNSIIFGDLYAGYIVRTVRGVQTMRLAERYAELLQVAFFGWSRMDAMVQDPNAVRTYQNSAT